MPRNALPALRLRAAWVRLAIALSRASPLLSIWTLDVLTFGLFTVRCSLLPAAHTASANSPPARISCHPIYENLAARRSTHMAALRRDYPQIMHSQPAVPRYDRNRLRFGIC